MNGFYDILMVLFIFGIVSGLVNEVSFGTKMPDSGFTISEDAVTGVQESAESQTSSDFSVWEVIASFMRVIGSGVTAMFLIYFTIMGLFGMVGFSGSLAASMAAAVQAVVTFITLFGLYEWWTGRSVT